MSFVSGTINEKSYEDIFNIFRKDVKKFIDKNNQVFCPTERKMNSIFC
jgi:hypothetical protein